MIADEDVQMVAISARPNLSAAAARLRWEAFPFFASKGIEIDGLTKIISAETAEAVPPNRDTLESTPVSYICAGSSPPLPKSLQNLTGKRYIQHN